MQNRETSIDSLKLQINRLNRDNGQLTKENIRLVEELKIAAGALAAANKKLRSYEKNEQSRDSPVNNTSAVQDSQLEEVFDKIDKDQDGLISGQDFVFSIRSDGFVRESFALDTETTWEGPIARKLDSVLEGYNLAKPPLMVDFNEFNRRYISTFDSGFSGLVDTFLAQAYNKPSTNDDSFKTTSTNDGSFKKLSTNDSSFKKRNVVINNDDFGSFATASAAVLLARDQTTRGLSPADLDKSTNHCRSLDDYDDYFKATVDISQFCEPPSQYDGGERSARTNSQRQYDEQRRFPQSQYDGGERSARTNSQRQFDEQRRFPQSQYDGGERSARTNSQRQYDDQRRFPQSQYDDQRRFPQSQFDEHGRGNDNYFSYDERRRNNDHHQKSYDVYNDLEQYDRYIEDDFKGNRREEMHFNNQYNRIGNDSQRYINHNLGGSLSGVCRRDVRSVSRGRGGRNLDILSVNLNRESVMTVKNIPRISPGAVAAAQAARVEAEVKNTVSSARQGATSCTLGGGMGSNFRTDFPMGGSMGGCSRMVIPTSPRGSIYNSSSTSTTPLDIPGVGMSNKRGGLKSLIYPPSRQAPSSPPPRPLSTNN
eukprot:GHVL01013905.1.p1 GENE.GHVL01013905.1~~GHVL01013905.1.p1  ORF type:complete len:595 (+),score=141.29 GHVL01013905.1:23-1807(+)